MWWSRFVWEERIREMTSAKGQSTAEPLVSLSFLSGLGKEASFPASLFQKREEVDAYNDRIL